MNKFSLNATDYGEVDTTLILVIHGQMKAGEDICNEGDIIFFEPGEHIDLFPLTDVEMMFMHFSGTENELRYIKWSNFHEMESGKKYSC